MTEKKPDLPDADVILRQQIAIDRLESQVIYGMHVEEFPTYYQGAQHEAMELMTADEANHHIHLIKELKQLNTESFRGFIIMSAIAAAASFFALWLMLSHHVRP